jgi:hypothetical protein
MMQGVHVKLNPELPRQKQHSTRRRLFSPANIIWTDCVRNEEVLRRVKEERNILHTIKEEKLTGLVTSCVETAL